MQKSQGKSIFKTVAKRLFQTEITAEEETEMLNYWEVPYQMDLPIKTF